MGVNFLKYSILRVGLMAAVFFLCMWLGIGLVFSGIFAILIAFAVAYLLFPRLHADAGRDLQGWFSSRQKKSPRAEAVEEDAAIEDEYAERQRRQDGIDF